MIFRSIRLLALTALLITPACTAGGSRIASASNGGTQRQYYTSPLMPTHVFRYSNDVAYKLSTGGQLTVSQELTQAVSRADGNAARKNLPDLGSFTKAGLGAYAASDMNASSEYGNIMADLVLKANVEAVYIDVESARLDPASDDRAIVSDPNVPVIAYAFDSFVPLSITPPDKQGLAIVIRDINAVDIEHSTVVRMRDKASAPELDWSQLPELPPPTSLQQAMRDGFGEARTCLFAIMNQFKIIHEFPVQDDAMMLGTLMVHFSAVLEQRLGVQNFANEIGPGLGIYAQFKMSPEGLDRSQVLSMFGVVAPETVDKLVQTGLLDAGQNPTTVEEMAPLVMRKLRAKQPDLVSKVESYLRYLNYYRSEVLVEGLNTWSSSRALTGDALTKAVADAHAKGLTVNLYEGPSHAAEAAQPDTLPADTSDRPAADTNDEGLAPSTEDSKRAHASR